MGITIRDWKCDDLADIQRSWIEFCQDAVRSDMQLKPEPDRIMIQWLLARFKDKSVFGLIAEQDSMPMGFLIGRVDLWESVPPIVESRKLGMIDAVHVHQAYRRRGVAVALIHRALDVMRERGAMSAETVYDAWSEASTETWRRAGFAPWMVHAYRML
jgi:GNAT superfamily N-acetyltransferase